ncbi:MAG: hypothetical protein ACI92Z_002130 [Paracoccaceae bacterium]|jgi:hypothetical protein
MIKVVILALVISCMLAGSAWAQQMQVPSGQLVTLTEVLIDEQPGEVWVRFRFIAPEISRQGGSVSYDIAAPDMDHLCEMLVLPYLQEYALTPARVVISLSDRDVPFGASAPEATQFFEAYMPKSSRCIWEEF